MLKGRSKNFAPKKGPRRPGPTSAVPPVRPSVERQSQTTASTPSTTAPEIRTQNAEKEPTNIAAQDSAQPKVSIPSQPDASRTSQIESAPVGTVESTDEPITAHLKRKTREEEEEQPDPAPKRVAIETETIVPEASTAGLSTPTSMVPTVHTSTPQIASEALPHRVDDRVSIGIESTSSQLEPTIQSTPTTIPPTSSNLPPLASEHSSTETSIPPPVQNESHHPRSAPVQHTEPEDIRSALIRQSAAESQNERGRSPSRDRTPNPPPYRYPSPENIARLADEVPGVATGSAHMGPAGGTISSGLGPAGDVNIAARTSELVPMAVLNPDGSSGQILAEQEPASGTEKGKKKRKYTKRRKVVQEAEEGDDGRATVEMQLNRPRRSAGSKRVRKRKDGGEKRRKERAETPEGASDEEIDHTTMTMTDLCKDLKIGKKFSRHDEIKERISKKKKLATKEKIRRNHPELVDLIDADGEAQAEPGEVTAGPSGTNREAEEEAPEVVMGNNMGPQMRIVDGNLVLDESSLQIDRHKRAQAEQEEFQEIEENEFSRVVTSGTYMKRERAQAWDRAATDLFYRGLNQFGTDFESIAKLFPHRNRRQIKLKFNSEERKNPAKVTKYLIGPKKPIDLEHFEKMSEIKLESVEAIKAEEERYDQEQREEIAKVLEAAAEVTRQKKAEIQRGNGSVSKDAARRILATMGSDDEGEPGTRAEGDSAKENSGPGFGPAPGGKKGKKPAQKKSKKDKRTARLGGEEVEVLGTID